LNDDTRDDHGGSLGTRMRPLPTTAKRRHGGRKNLDRPRTRQVGGGGRDARVVKSISRDVKAHLASATMSKSANSEETDTLLAQVPAGNSIQCWRRFIHYESPKMLDPILTRPPPVPARVVLPVSGFRHLGLAMPFPSPTYSGPLTRRASRRLHNLSSACRSSFFRHHDERLLSRQRTHARPRPCRHDHRASGPSRQNPSVPRVSPGYAVIPCLQWRQAASSRSPLE